MPIFTDKAGVRHYSRHPLDVIEGVGGLETNIMVGIAPNGALVGYTVTGTFEGIVKAYRDEEAAMAFGGPLVPNETIQ